MDDTIVHFETMESFERNKEHIFAAMQWALEQKPELKFKIVILPDGMKNWREN